MQQLTGIVKILSFYQDLSAYPALL